MANRVLVTGGAGFIGSSLVDSLLQDGYSVIIVDNLDPFYARQQKESNIAGFLHNSKVRILNLAIENMAELRAGLEGEHFEIIVHLAAKAGVRFSIQDPAGYLDVNIKGTQNLLEIAKERGVKQFVFASSSSVYGVNANTPWSEDDYVLKPISPYASTKLSGELLGHVYAHLYNIRFIALRFFTVYGPRQRPDLAIHKFSLALLEDKPIVMFGDGTTSRDYTYIDDIVHGIRSAMDYKASIYEIINLGNNRTVSLKEMIDILCSVFNRKAKIVHEPEQPGDVHITYANISKAAALLNYHPSTTFEDGIVQFRNWLLTYTGR